MFKKFRGGVHPPDNKWQTENLNVEEFLDFDQVFIPLRQHVGVEAELCIEEGDYVKAGQVIAKSENAPWIHSSISGNVEKIEKRFNRVGNYTMGVLIKNDKHYKHVDYHERKNIEKMSKNEFLTIIREAGISGMGGGMFPTYRKMENPGNQKIEHLVINAAECEPYLNADNRLLIESTDNLLKGIKLIKKLYKIPNIIIGIEDNKKEAIDKLKALVGHDHEIKIEKLHTMYPQGGEKQLLQSLFGKEMTGLPIDYGVIVLNPATCVAIYEALLYNKPLIERIVTVSGGAVSKPKNLKVKLGTSVEDLLNHCEVKRDNIYKLILGGPMMGFAISDEKEVVIKGTNGVLALSEKETKPYKSKECISCGKCLDVCPMGLVPLKYVELFKNDRTKEMLDFDLKKCIRCSSCQFACPVNQPLMEAIWYGFTFKE